MTSRVHARFESVYLCTGARNGIDVKVSDFGLSNLLRGDMLRSQCGTPVYMAPEMLQVCVVCPLTIAM
jgi:serine/threonine protein kinase